MPQIRLSNHTEDTPTTVQGLIPYERSPVPVPERFTPQQVVRARNMLQFQAGAVVVLLALLAGASSLFVLPNTQVATPIMAGAEVVDIGVDEGASIALRDYDVIAATHAALTAQKGAFLEVDFTTWHVRYYEAGELVITAPIVASGAELWRATPAGVYQIEDKRPTHTSVYGDAVQKDNLVFAGNSFIHAWPQYENGTDVPESYAGDGIRLTDEDAAALYERVAIETPVLVYQAPELTASVVYGATVPGVTAEAYIVADIADGSVVAAQEHATTLPIASLTKLMTALVAVETIDLDSMVSVTQEQYVTTLIPRLSGRYRTSMRSLFELLLLESSNEAAEVIAAQLGREHFIDLMNKKAAALGLSDTTFADPSGLDDGNVASAADLFTLTQYIATYRPFIFEMTRAGGAEHYAGELGELTNFNVVKGMANFAGGKIGETLAAGQTSVSLHTVVVEGHERTLAVILLGSQERNADIKRVLDFIAEHYTLVLLE